MRRFTKVIGTALALALAAPGVASAQAEPGMGMHAGQLDVPLNKSQVLTVDRPFARVMVGNDEIADIMPVTNQSVYVLGKKFGTTSVTLYDSAGRVISIVDIAVGPDVVALRRQLSQLLPGEQIGASVSNDAIVLTGIASSAPAVDRAVQLAKTYAGDAVVNMVSVGASQQIMLEVRFSEINRQAAKNIGVGAFLQSDGGTFDGALGNGAGLIPNPGNAAGGVGGAIPDPFGAGVLTRSPITDSFGVFRKIFDIGSLNIDGTLDLLESKGLVKTLAEPTLIALSGETASFLAGGEFPIPVIQGFGGGGGGAGGAGGGQGITIEFKPFGVSLAFTPTVLADGVINLVVEPEVSSLDPSAAVSINGLSIPGLKTRRASTVLELRDGEAFAIAGLLQQDFSDTVRQVPLLGSIPIIGALFRSTGFRKGETELVIVVTPRLVQPVKPEQIALPTDRVGTPSEGELFLLGRTDKAVGIDPLDPDAPPPEAASQPAAKGGSGYEY